MFLLATGERGIGWEAARRLNKREFELLWFLQQRVIRASSEEGREELAQEAAIRKAIALDTRESRPMPPPDPSDPYSNPLAIDFDRATPAQLAAFIAARRAQAGWED